MTTLQPFFASKTAVAAPTPVADPVTIATLPSMYFLHLLIRCYCID